LRLVLDGLAVEIDRLKAGKDAGGGELETLMARALGLTQEIQAEQSKLRERRTSLGRQRRALEATYTAILDSLQRLDSDDESVRRQELQYAEKKILISESVNSLSYDPKRVDAIALAQASDSLEKQLFLDYLNNALEEVDVKLKDVQSTRAELRDILLLRERTAQFLQEVDSEGIVGFLQTPGDQSVLTNDGVVRESDAFSSGQTVWSDQIQAYLSIAQQLEGSAVPLNMAPELDAASDPGPSDYLKLLDRIVKQLQSYRRIITQKLGEN
jgi:hypothetical protein